MKINKVKLIRRFLEQSLLFLILINSHWTVYLFCQLVTIRFWLQEWEQEIRDPEKDWDTKGFI